VQRDIKPVRQRAGEVRDMDVLTGFATTLHAAGEDECRILLLEHLGSKRMRQARKVSYTLACGLRKPAAPGKGSAGMCW